VHRTALVQIISVIGTVTAVAYGIGNFRGRRWFVPTSHWQIPARWSAYGHPVFAIQFGFFMGFGFLTVVNSVATYLMFVVCFLLAEPTQAGVVMLVFAACRVIPIGILSRKPVRGVAKGRWVVKLVRSSWAAVLEAYVLLFFACVTSARWFGG
jgi:hypothetical protein